MTIIIPAVIMVGGFAIIAIGVLAKGREAYTPCTADLIDCINECSPDSIKPVCFFRCSLNNTKCDIKQTFSSLPQTPQSYIPQNTQTESSSNSHNNNDAYNVIDADENAAPLPATRETVAKLKEDRERFEAEREEFRKTLSYK